MKEGHVTVEGKAQAADAAPGFFLAKVVQDAVLDVKFIELVLTGQGMKHVVVEIRNLAAVELGLEDILCLIESRQDGRRHLVGQIDCVAGIFLQGLADEGFGLPVVVEPGRIKIIDAVAIGKIDHLLA